ncbi:MAG: LD-carboxypeptidase, partial [Pseudomonadota bacterium]
MNKGSKSTNKPHTRSRREFLATSAMLSAMALTPVPGGRARGASLARAETIMPARLEANNLVALVNPASARYQVIPTEIMAESIEALGLRVRRSANYFARRGYMAGTDQQRADDINAAFADPEVKAIWATGGWGSARVLPLLDYDLIRANPKVLVGYSDATALLNAVYSKTGLVNFHGPFPRSPITAAYQRSLLIDAQGADLTNPQRVSDDETVVTQHRIRTLTSGTAEGKLIGGNLTVLSAIVGSDFLPSFDGAILFLEDVNEAVYRVDRMLTQLKLAGILERISGFVFGNCTECDPDSSYGSLTLEEAIRDHIDPLGVPAWMGAMVG